MAQSSRPTIDLDCTKQFIYIQFCELGSTLKEVILLLEPSYHIQVSTQTLTQRLHELGFSKYASRISSILLPTLQTRIVPLFYHHILTDKEIIRVLHGEGYEHLTLCGLQMLRLSIGISRHLRTGNFLTNTEEIKEILEQELNVECILYYGRQRVYEHLWRQGYLIARLTILILNIQYILLILFYKDKLFSTLKEVDPYGVALHHGDMLRKRGSYIVPGLNYV